MGVASFYFQIRSQLVNSSLLTTIEAEQIKQYRFRVCLTSKLGNSNLAALHLFLSSSVCLFHTGNKSFLSTQSSPVWVLRPFNGSFHLTVLCFTISHTRAPLCIDMWRYEINSPYQPQQHIITFTLLSHYSSQPSIIWPLMGTFIAIKRFEDRRQLTANTICFSISAAQPSFNC